MNRLVLTAVPVQRSALRYTPAGLPALDLQLMHQSQLSEDGVPRKVQLELRAVAIGAITRSVQALPLDQPRSFAGFLAAARNGRGVLFHITEVAEAA